MKSVPAPISYSRFPVPAIIHNAGEHARQRFWEFLTAEIDNENTRAAYARALRPFLIWCEKHGRALEDIDPVMVAAYRELLKDEKRKPQFSTPTVKQHLAAIRRMFDYLVEGGVLPFNPAASVRGPKYSVKKGKTPVLKPEEARLLLDSIDISELAGLRDRALIGVMVYSFARVSAVIDMSVEDYYQPGKRWWLRLHEKGGKRHEVPVHHSAEEYLDAYIEAAGIGEEKKKPLWRSLTKTKIKIPGTDPKERTITQFRLSRIDVFRMIEKRCDAAGLGDAPNCHTFRATGITAYLLNGGTIENAQAIAAHESPRTTKLYDRTSDEITLDEVEPIVI